ncbi:hypothetical protein ACFPC0_09705 [Streptomyces andamanensis]|uniref:Uncharacterized protein n=1 Tax=Streptomyces andamanensis TaxID=1565035 RepID=A0ABV8TBU9_9ACTN
MDGGISSVGDPLAANMDIDAVAAFAPRASQFVYEARWWAWFASPGMPLVCRREYQL